MDSIKSYLKENEHALMKEVPSPWVKQSIITRVTNLKLRKKTLLYQRIAIAASVLVFIAGFYFSAGIGLKQSHKPAGTANTQFVRNNPKTAQKEYSRNQAVLTASSRPLLIAHTRNVKAKAANFGSKVPEPVTTLQHRFGTLVDTYRDKVGSLAVYSGDTAYFNTYRDRFEILMLREKNLTFLTRQQDRDQEAIQELIDIYQRQVSLLIRLQAAINELNNQALSDTTNKQHPFYITL